MEINDKIILDKATKTAIIMRDGIYMYLAREVGDNSRPASDIVKVYRDEKEIKKAKARFEELQRLPITINHPLKFLDLKDEESYSKGSATDCFKKDVDSYKTLGCKLNLNDETFELYEKGIRELSCGWVGSFVKVDNEDYEYIQEFEDFNHIALLPDGRGGSLCSIIDNNINLIKIMSEHKEDLLKDIRSTIVDAISEEKENKDKKKTKDEDELEKDETKDEEEVVKDEEEKVKDKKKKTKDEDKKENEDEDEDKKETKDSAIVDAKSIEDAMISDFSSIFEAIEKGAIDVKDCIGKAPLEIKQKAVEKLAKKTIDLSNTAVLDAYFSVSVENYSHPSWATNEVKDSNSDIADSINNINFLK